MTKYPKVDGGVPINLAGKSAIPQQRDSIAYNTANAFPQPYYRDNSSFGMRMEPNQQVRINGGLPPQEFVPVNSEYAGFTGNPYYRDDAFRAQEANLNFKVPGTNPAAYSNDGFSNPYKAVSSPNYQTLSMSNDTQSKASSQTFTRSTSVPNSFMLNESPRNPADSLAKPMLLKPDQRFDLKAMQGPSMGAANLYNYQQGSPYIGAPFQSTTEYADSPNIKLAQAFPIATSIVNNATKPFETMNITSAPNNRKPSDPQKDFDENPSMRMHV